MARALHIFLKKHKIRVTHSRRHADLLITIGGDGTILREKKHCDLPIFGIGSKSSFVCQARKDDWKKVLSKALRRPRVEERMLLMSWLNGKRLEDAMNDVFVRNSDHRILEFDLRIDKKRFKFEGDGVIFSTPTGSTAYAYSAGGKELTPSSRKYEIVGIAPYRRSFKPQTVDEGKTSEVIIHTERSAIAVVDGQFSHRLKAGRNRLLVKKAKRKIKLLNSSN